MGNLSSSDDSDLEDLLFDDDANQMFVLLAAKELEDRTKKRHL
jgi:type III secretory pathway lipoprotein EscJ